MEQERNMQPSDQNKYDVTGIGTVKISEEVVGVIAGIAASEIDGVSGLNPTTTGDITQVLTGKRNVTKGVKVSLGDKSTIDMILSVDYGYNIPDVIAKVQENVQITVENITGLKVAQVNVLVHNINIKKEAAKDGK